MAIGVTLWHGRLVFPIGRHSLMHTWVPNTPAPTLRAHGGDGNALASSVYRAGIAVIRGGERLHEWAPVIVRRTLERLRLGSGVYVSEYLMASVRDNYYPRFQTFGELCEFVKALTPAPTAHS